MKQVSHFSLMAAAILTLTVESFGQYQPWNNPGRVQTANPQQAAGPVVGAAVGRFSSIMRRRWAMGL